MSTSATAPARRTSGIIRRKLADRTIYYVDDGFDYLEVLDRFYDGSVSGRRLANNCPERKVYHLIHKKREFVLKIDREVESRLEMRFLRYVNGPMYPALMRRIHAAVANGCDIAQPIFLVAERVNRPANRETVILAEYLHGEAMTATNDMVKYGREVIEAIQTLHRHGLALVDINPGNFLRSDSGMKLIDLTSHSYPLLDRAKDIARLRYEYGLDCPIDGVIDQTLVRTVTWSYQWRAFLRALKRRVGLRHECPEPGEVKTDASTVQDG